MRKKKSKKSKRRKRATTTMKTTARVWTRQTCRSCPPTRAGERAVRSSNSSRWGEKRATSRRAHPPHRPTRVHRVRCQVSCRTRRTTARQAVVVMWTPQALRPQRKAPSNGTRKKRNSSKAVTRWAATRRQAKRKRRKKKRTIHQTTQTPRQTRTRMAKLVTPLLVNKKLSVNILLKQQFKNIWK